jgi:hypothetical protein
MRENSLHKGVAFASTGHRIPVKIDKFKFTKWFENLFDIRLCKVEMQGSDV